MLVENIELDWPIRKARPGTKSKTLQLLAKLGIVSVLDLLAHLPRSYENRTHITSIADACEGERQTFEGYIYRMSNSHQRVNGKLRPAQIGLLYQDEREVVSQRDYLQIVWFGQKHLVSTLRRYYRLRVHGTVRVDPQTGRPQLFQPEYDVIAEPWGPTEPAVNSGRIVPIYPLTTGLRQDFLRVMIWQFLEKYHTQLERSHPGETGHSLGQILWTVNFPREEHHPALARAELAVDEILEAQMALSHLRAERKKARFAVAIPVNRRAPGNSSPLSLSPSQTRAVEEIRNDFTRSGTPMNRVLQGDLDSDIMTVALCVMLDAARANQQSVLIAPTELLAEHYMRVVADLIGADSGSLAPGLIEATLPHHMRSFIVALLTSPVRDDLLKEITSGSVDLVIGTPAAVDKIAAFDQLGLVVNADQRPLGFVPEPRVTRDAHCLTLTTVPMPPAIRSTLYRDLAFSAIDPNAMVQTVKKVQKSGIRVLIHSDDLAKQVARHFVGPDQYYGQSAVAKAAAEELGGKGKVALMEGVPGNMSSILRKRGAKDTLAKYKGIKVVGTWAANWDRAQGLKKAEDILTAHPDISAIIAVNDDMALGALQAVKARGKLGKIIVTGFNGVEEAVQEVYRGNMLATVLTFCDSVGKQLVRTGVDVAMDRDDKSKYTIDTGTIPLETKLLQAVGKSLKAGVK